MSQSQFMERDTVLVLDANDNVVGSASKRESHVFSHETPRGILHRAFSVFLFEAADDGTPSRLLLQKRASTKITFPNVWTNTCCSHPLHGMDNDEVDDPDDVESGTVRGAKYAAMRKLGHELGVKSDELKVRWGSSSSPTTSILSFVNNAFVRVSLTIYYITRDVTRRNITVGGFQVPHEAPLLGRRHCHPREEEVSKRR